MKSRLDYLKDIFYSGKTPVDSDKITLIDLRRKVRELNRILTEHIGSDGEKPHTTATPYINGFMSKEHVNQLNSASGLLQWVKGVNVETLPVGHYIGNTLTALPFEDSGLWYVDVKTHTSDPLCKIINVTQSATGLKFERGWHLNGATNSIPNAWRSIKTETILWQGSATNVNDKMQSSLSPRIFSELKIEGELFDGTSIRGFKQNISTSDNIKITDVNLSNNLESFLYSMYECNIRLGANNEFYILSNRIINFDPVNNTVENSQEGLLTITSITGIK